MPIIENRTFDEIKIGEFGEPVTHPDQGRYRAVCGDVGRRQSGVVDEVFARDDMFHKIIAHGMWGGALISTVLGTELPGAGTVYRSQTLNFRRPITLGDTVVVSVTVREKNAADRCIVLDCRVVNQDGQVVIDGTAEIIAPTEKISRERVTLPEVHLEDRGARHRQLIAQAQERDPIRTAVVNPTDAVSLIGAVEAAKAKLIVPILIGPADAIKAAAKSSGIDISG